MREKLKQRDIIAAYLSVLQKARYQYKESDIGNPAWRLLYNKPCEGNVIDASGPPNEIIIHPITRPGYIVFKYFRAPFPDYRDYFNVHTFDDIICAVQKQIEDGEYRTFRPIPFAMFLERPAIRKIFDSDDEQHQKELLRFCLAIYPKEALEAQRLRHLLCKIFDRRNYASDVETREQAEDDLKKLTAPSMRHYGNKGIPPFFYLGGLYDYIQQMTLEIKRYWEDPNKDWGGEPRACKAVDQYERDQLLETPEDFTWSMINRIFPSFENRRSIKNKRDRELPLFKNPEKYSIKPPFSHLIYSTT